MTGEPSLAVVLRAQPLRESDLLVTLFTDSHGRVSAVARGARKSQRRFAGALQLLVLARVQLGRPPRGELWSLERAEIVREWTSLASNVVAVAHASYIAELVGALLPAESPEPHALELVTAMWDSLAEGGPSPAALRASELVLLELAGHTPALEACAACGETDLASGAVFDPTRGGAICRRCAAQSRGPGVRPLDAATRAYLVAAQLAGAPGPARALDTDPAFSAADRVAARDAMLAMVTSYVDRPLRSLEYLAKLRSTLVNR
ncbi:MAG TPA: DNA repair protein RecO [Kofleriaceae bacterium]